MNRAETITQLLADTADLDQAAFVARYPYPFLVREMTRPSGEWEAVPELAGDEERPTARITMATAPAGDGFARDEVYVYRVCPADADRAEGGVVIGRGRGCDVVVEDESISTRHAEFTLHYDEDEDEKTFLVADLGSSNGTFLDGKRLEPNSPRPIDDSMSLRLGPAVKLQFFTAPAFHLFLTFYRRIPPKGRK